MCHHDVTTASKGFTAFATKYPPTTSGFRRSIRSVRYPEKSFANEATLSAIPSISPNCAGPAPSDTRNAGKTQYAISVAVSLKNEVSPNQRRLRAAEGRASKAGTDIHKFYHLKNASGKGELGARGSRLRTHDSCLIQYIASYFVTTHCPAWFSTVSVN